MTSPASSSAAAAAGLPATVDLLTAEVVALYGQAEQDLIAAIARIARHGLNDPAAVTQLAMLTQMQRAAQRVATALALRSGPLAQRIASEAAQRGDAAAQVMLRRIVEADPGLARLYLSAIRGASGHGVAAAAMIGLDLAGKLAAARYGIVRYADDAYRGAVTEASTRLVIGREALTPGTAQRLAWQELTRAGITGYRDAAGRRWNLASYVEMATRTAVQRAYNTAHQARMTAVGITRFTISHDGHPCPLCGPWEGRVLTASDLDEARAAGLFHPNCRHTLLPYFPGITKPTAPGEWTAADADRYQATQQLRALERRVRAYKREQAGALDQVTAQRAARRVRATQALIRAHVARHQLVRRTHREQLHLGHH